MLFRQDRRKRSFSASGAEALSRGLCESRPGNSRGGAAYDLPVVGQASARANGRDTVGPWDLPITEGLQESIHRFGRLDEEVELKPMLEQLAVHPPLDRTPTRGTEERGLSVALAETFKITQPGEGTRRPATGRM
ncbi:DUF1931 family protein [Streptomyces flaveolus]|uniref:DUF1931 family protein n=1 Tax=Streptomyces flaveolus TaxID=67297 RepID=UPI0036FFC05E